MSLEEARKIITNWLYSGERIDEQWNVVLHLCLKLIDEKINVNNDEK